jgi:tRNA 2-selenouridine synthase
MSDYINIDEFFKLSSEIPIADVRSPSEFFQGHIPGAINIPLFDDNERAIVGTLYKNSGQKEAVLAGLEIAGNKMRILAEKGLNASQNKKIIVHCWRGGMRSASVAWLFETCGIKAFILNGGYKAYRTFIFDYFSKPLNLLILGGLTGSGKSVILQELEVQSFQVLKLETLANHKGSAFGNLGEPPQNSNEQFENDIFTTLRRFDPDKPIFVEDESRNIGRNIIPVRFLTKCLQVL